MKIYPLVSLFVFWMCLGGLFPVPGYGADPDREALADLLSDLDKKIEEADKRMIAHPNFLDELRALVQQYRAKLRTVFFNEDFSDGDYTRRPTWVVDLGTFTISASGRLLSRTPVERPVAAPSSEEDSPLTGILQKVIQSSQEKREDEGSTPAVKEARIHLSLESSGPLR